MLARMRPCDSKNTKYFRLSGIAIASIDGTADFGLIQCSNVANEPDWSPTKFVCKGVVSAEDIPLLLCLH